MTDRELILALRTIEIPDRHACFGCGYGHSCGLHGCVIIKAAINRLEAAQQSNNPLTLEELREMDGEPVWVETTDIKKANRWAFVDVGSEVVRFFDTRCGVKCPVMGNLFRTYGKTWFAYRRKPEEGVT